MLSSVFNADVSVAAATLLLQSPGRSRRGSPAAEKLPPGFVGQPLLKISKDKLR